MTCRNKEPMGKASISSNKIPKTRSWTHHSKLQYQGSLPVAKKKKNPAICIFTRNMEHLDHGTGFGDWMRTWINLKHVRGYAYIPY
jgi:hypothetical protein